MPEIDRIYYQNGFKERMAKMKPVLTSTIINTSIDNSVKDINPIEHNDNPMKPKKSSKKLKITEMKSF